MKVFFADIFSAQFVNFPKADQLKIAEFVFHVSQNGLTGLKGRNKPSHEVPTDDNEWRQKVKYAQDNQLWHYHIGIPSYTQSQKGDFTSEYVLHYILADDYIMLVDMSAHPPLELPKPEYFVKSS